MSSISLETKRLAIRSLTFDDAQSLLSYRSLDKVTRFQTFKPKSLIDAIKFIDSASSELDITNRWHQLGLFNKQDNKHIGDIGIHFLNNIEETEIGCTLAPEYWNMGYATESLEAVITFLFNTLKKKKIIAYISNDNIRSCKLFRRLGFQITSRSNNEAVYQLI